MRVASIDIGTNSVRLFVAEQEGTILHRVSQELRVTRLGKGVDAEGTLTEEGMERTTAVLADYVDRIDQYSVQQVKLMATSAVRDASNKDQFLQLVRERTQLDVRVLSGTEEARLSFLGALASLPASIRPRDALVLDIGGGSTELFRGSGTDLLGGTSLQMGGVRMTERCVTGHPLSEADWNTLGAAVTTGLQPLLLMELPTDLPLIGVGGTATTAAALVLGMSEYDPEAITGEVLSLQSVIELGRHLAELSLAERLALPGMTPGREDVVVAGMVILRGVMELLQREEITISDGDLLQGVFLESEV